MKLINASCIGGIVTSEGKPVLGTTVLSEGVGSSSGVLLLQDDDGKIYIAKTSPDLKSTLDQLTTALTQIGAALTVLDAKPVGGVGSAPAPAAAGNITSIAAANTALTALKAILK